MTRSDIAQGKKESTRFLMLQKKNLRSRISKNKQENESTKEIASQSTEEFMCPKSTNVFNLPFIKISDGSTIFANLLRKYQFLRTHLHECSIMQEGFDVEIIRAKS